MGQKTSKSTETSKGAPSKPSGEPDLTSDSSDDSPPKNKNHIADNVSPDQAKDEDSARSLAHLHRFGDKSPEPECDESENDAGKKSGEGIGTIVAPISDDESDPGGEEGNQEGMCQFMSQLSLDQTLDRPSVSPDSAESQPVVSLLTDDESDIDDNLVVNDRSLFEISSPGKLQELSISARLRGSISEISSEGSSESSDESCEADVPAATTPVPQPAPAADSEKNDQGVIQIKSAVATTSENPECSPKPVKSFYIPRENKIPDTKDATIKSTAFERLKKGGKSKLFSNVLTDANEHRVKSVERVWKSFVRLSDKNDLQKLLTLNEPILMNFKLIELKRSYESIIRNATDFTTCSIMFEILGEITRSKFEAHKAEVFQELATPQFIRNLHAVVEKCDGTRPKQTELTRFIENFVDIYEDIFLQLDSLATDGLAADLEELIGKCISLVEKRDDQSCAEQLQQLLVIIESRDTLIRANSSYPFNILKEESVESNIIDGPYDNVDHYLTVHYRLMKEDFQNSLRVGVIDYLKNIHGLKRKAINNHLNIFKNVTLATHLTSYALKYKIIFYDPIVLAKLRDPASPHFLTGSLLILTNSHFEDYYLFRAEDKSPLEREQNHIFVSMVLGPPSLPQMVHFDVMAEPSRLFEPYYRVLNVIRSIDGHHFPFLRYIVNVETDVFPPAFMKPDTELKIDGYACSLWEDETWPAPECVGLNPVQLDGLKQALRNEISIIQGPPGTGKTYLSKKIIEILLQNKTLWHQNDSDGAGLIMVVCFKNQSLDQLLTGLIRDKVKVLRIGTQSKEEMLDAYNLKTLMDPKYSQIYRKMRWLLAEEQKDMIEDLQDSLEMIEEINAHSGIIKLEYFLHLLRLDENNRSYLMANYEKWLLEIPCVEPDFRAVEYVLGEQSWMNFNVEIQSDVYQITLRDVENILERTNAKLDVLKELGDSDYVQLLNSAAVYLVQKLKFMEDRLYDLKRSMSEVERLELYNFKKEFEKEEQRPLEGLPVDRRWVLYKAWMRDLYLHHTGLIDSMVAKSQANGQRYVEIEELLNMRKIAQCDAEVVGLTTTAAAKYFKMMDCLKPKIVLVEEAAEVMEAHTVASLSKYCEHLILVGDHKQLRPLTSSHIIGKEAHLDYSMYERLVRNGFTPCTLNTQYRMRPDIADLIRPAVYEELFDDPSVHQYPQVLGIDANLYFVDHSVKENVTPDIVSRWNKHEAEFHLALCNYLVLQGYEPSQITILATYSEQEKYFNKEKLNYPHLEEVLMATVDSFQGKENDIILLSLVRSNAEAVIGFLAQENRINVALSRAKVGLFITGNKSNLLARNGLWTRVVQVLQKKKAIGLKLPLKCQIHGKVSPVASSFEIKALKNGGCAKQCKAPLPCGHKCIHMCHPLDREHKVTYKCASPCDKPMDCSHRCILTCHSTNPLVFKCFCKTCPAECQAPLPCGHLCNRKAHKEDAEHKSTHRCPEICNEELPCGHICVSLCHPEDAKHENTHKCPILCEGTLMCGHECPKKYLKEHPCSDHRTLCNMECGTALSCGHICHQPCHRTDRDHLNEFRCVRCEETQEKPCKPGHVNFETKIDLPEACMHGKLIYAGECREKCGFRYPCGHSCDKRCSHVADRNHDRHCDRMCNTFLLCGHKCTSLCHFKWFPHSPANAGSWNCKICDKPQKIYSMRISETIFDQGEGNQECGFLFQCGHRCARKVGTHTHNSDANTAICKRECGATLTCGHTCKQRCHFKSASVHELPDSCGECKKEVDTSWRAGSWMQARKIELHRQPPKKGADEPVCAHGTAMIIECDHECGFQYKCSHICHEKCRHAAGNVHPNSCTAICNAFLDCGHNCKLQCHYSISPHNALDKCYDCLKWKIDGGIDVSKMAEHHEINYECTGDVLFEVCSHGNMLKFGCRKRCGTTFECGHTCRERCFHQKDPKHLRDCLSPCGTFLSCGHICTVPCHFKILRHQPMDRCMGCQASMPKEQMCQHGKSSKSGCNLSCNFSYKCGHRCAEKCQHMPFPSHDQSCPQACNQILPCGHPCTMGCHPSASHMDPAECKECSKSESNQTQDEPLIYCMHEKLMLHCNEKCPGKLACGHKCFSKLRKAPHPCSKHLAAAAHMCQKKCKAILSCGHHCSGKCHMGSELHVCKKCDKSSFLLPAKPKQAAKETVQHDNSASSNEDCVQHVTEGDSATVDADDSVSDELSQYMDSAVVAKALVEREESDGFRGEIECQTATSLQ